MLAIFILLFQRAGAYDAEVRLYRNLLLGYEADVRPSERHDRPVNVSFAFSLTQIIDVDERNQIMTTNAWIRQKWVDYKLTWNPADYDNITRIHIPHNKLWKPDVVLYNNADSHYSTSVMSTDALVTFSGNVTWSAAGIFKSSCPLDVRFYPFDVQSCMLKFASWAYDGTKIDILLNSEVGDQSNYMTSTEWHLNLIRAEKNYVRYSCCPEPYPFVDIHITIQRRPMFYVFNLILPCVLISAIALLGFYMPSDSGEKVTLGITSLLSTTVFLMLVAEGMPPTSEALPLIGIYYGVTIFIVSLATAMTVLTLNVHHHGVHGKAVPVFVQKFVFRFVARILFLRIEAYHSITTHVNHIYQKEYANDERLMMECARNAVNENRNHQPDFLEQGDELQRSIRNKKVSFSSDTSGAQPEGAPTDDNNSTFADVFENEFLRVLSRVHATIERNELRMAEKDRREATKLEWQQVALVLDRFLLLVFIIGTAATSLSIIYQRELFFS